MPYDWVHLNSDVIRHITNYSQMNEYCTYHSFEIIVLGNVCWSALSTRLLIWPVYVGNLDTPSAYRSK